MNSSTRLELQTLLLVTQWYKHGMNVLQRHIDDVDAVLYLSSSTVYSNSLLNTLGRHLL
jgi:hypothetical protein